MISVHISKLALLLVDRMQSHIFCTESGRFIAQKSAASGTKFGRLLVQKAADLLNQKRPPSGTNLAALLHKIRLVACTKTGRFIAKCSAAFCHYIRPLACTKTGRKAADLLN